MRILFFNIWHGKVWDELRDFIFNESSNTDIFCLTEVDPALHSKLVDLLPDFQPFYDEIIKTKYLNGGIDGQAIFVKKGIEVKSSGKKMIFPVNQNDAGILQFIEARGTTICSVHGKSRPGTKLDTPIRIKQSQIIIDFLKDKKKPKIIGGDFNLFPGTKSVAMFEEAGYRNLIKDFEIKTTRNKLSWEQFNNIQYFADFCFVSPDVKVKKFEVPNIEISDHLPLILEFEI